MKAKTIKTIIRKKIMAWLTSIEDETVRELAAKNTIVTGGCITSMLLNEPVNDFDIYFRDKETTLAVAKYYCKKFIELNGSNKNCRIKDPYVEELLDGRVRIVVKSAGVQSEEADGETYRYFESTDINEAAGEYATEVFGEDAIEVIMGAQGGDTSDEKPPYRPTFLSSNAITLSDSVQLITRFYGEPDEIHENYDFVHCTNHWDSKSGDLTLRKEALEAILTKELRYVGSKYPLTSIIRTRKFIKRGWTINVGQYVKMCMHLNDMDLTNIDVLEEQLTGVDVAYFAELIRKVRDKDAEKVDNTYICEILDRMF